MRKIISALITSVFALTIILPVSVSAAAVTGVTKLEITAPTTARVGEAIDITVRAVDKDKNTVTAYRGSVIFNTDNIGDTVPMPGKSYTFSADDSGQKVFSKGLIFKKSGKQKVYVTDVTDDIAGEATITVDVAATTSGSTDQTVTILTPENGGKITTGVVMISGKTRKNSKVNLKLNGKDAGTTNTDDSGIFTKSISDITQQDNILVAELIDGASTVLAKSPEVKFSQVITSSATYGVSITPSATIEVSSPIEITVDATPGLTELSVSLDGAVLVTKESTSGKYLVKTVAPKNPGIYKISIAQKDALGQVKNTESTTALTTTAKLEAPKPVPTFKNVKTTVVGSKIIFDFSVENPPTDLQSFKIAYGKNADSLTSEVTTYTLDRIQSKTTSGAYTWYIDKLDATPYTFKIFGRTIEGSLISGLVSEPIVATAGKESCTIGNVSNLVVKTDASKSIISWDALTGAVSYNLYRVSAAGDYALFENTKTPGYTLQLSQGAITYDNFAVKALCDDQTESISYSKMSKVQTGPGAIAIIVILAAGVAAFVMRRRAI